MPGSPEVTQAVNQAKAWFRQQRALLALLALLGQGPRATTARRWPDAFSAFK